MREKRLLIAGGTVVSETGCGRMDLLIEAERVKAVGLPGTFASEVVDEVCDASGKLVLPGLIDPHLHFNSPFMGTITAHGYDNGTIAAAYGGVTTLIDFSTQPKGDSILENLAQKEEEARGQAYIDWSVSGILLDASPQTLAEIPRLIEAGVPTYKCFTTYKHAGRLMDDESLLLILETTAQHGGMLMVHCEFDPILERRIRKELAVGHYAPIYHARTRPPETENIAIRRVIELVKEVEAPVYIVHTSTAASVAIIHDARSRGLPIHSETCPHYLTLTDEMLQGPNSQLYICSPPLRTQADVDALWRALANDCVEVISSDDAGVKPEDNLRIGAGRFDRVPSGLSSIETRLALLYTEGVCKGHISLSQLVALTSTNPARLFGLFPQKGHLMPGADADVVLYDPEQEWIMTASSLHMNTSFCAYEGWKIKGRVHSLLSRGAYVVRDGKLVGEPGRGQRVFRKIDTKNC